MKSLLQSAFISVLLLAVLIMIWLLYEANKKLEAHHSLLKDPSFIQITINDHAGNLIQIKDCLYTIKKRGKYFGLSKMKTKEGLIVCGEYLDKFKMEYESLGDSVKGD